MGGEVRPVVTGRMLAEVVSVGVVVEECLLAGMDWLRDAQRWHIGARAPGGSVALAMCGHRGAAAIGSSSPEHPSQARSDYPRG